MRVTLRHANTLLMALCLLPWLPERASAVPVRYIVTDLGTLPGYNASFARSINATGQVVGGLRSSTGEFRAFIWDQTYGMQDIGTLGGSFSEALAVNNNGEVVGASTVAVGGPQRAFLYSNGIMINLGDQSSGAEGINNSGEIVGYGQNGAFIWYSASGFRLIGGTSASAINDLGQVVGTASSRAFLYDAGGLHDLGTLGGGNSDAYDINNLGQVVGRAHTDPNDTLHAFLYSAGVMIDLGTFPAGVQSTAYGVNNFGQVVGDATTSIGKHQAFLYEAGVLYNLNDLIPTDAGWLLERGEDINDAGQIVGFGTISGERHAFLMTPASPYAVQVQQPINGNGASVFNAKRGVLPVQFTLTWNGTATCALPIATIAVFRISEGLKQPISESIYAMPADNGSYFRISGCQYIYNAAVSSLGPGSYMVQILIDGTPVGSATFRLK